MKPPSQAVLYSFAFFLTGVGTALLGSTLPATLHTWHLADSRGGLLLLAAWGGSTAGALLARKRLDRNAASGLALSAAALWGMATNLGGALPLLYLLYGVGLGTTMTSISLLRSRGVPPEAAGRELNRLNLVWAVGACCAPVLALHSLHLLSVVAIFRLSSAIFGLTAGIALALSLSSRSQPDLVSLAAPSSTPPRQLPWAPFHLCLFAAASVGLESAIGSWLTTYTERSTLAVDTAVSANAAFWVGLLLSRGLHSTTRVAILHTAGVRFGHLAAVAAGQAILLLHPARWTLVAAGLLCGWGLGPLYPLALSVALPRYRSTLVFVLAGIGASLVPWLTGLLSSLHESLRFGLLAPSLTFGLLLAAAVRMQLSATKNHAAFPSPEG